MRAAVAVARELGVEAAEPRVLGDRSNLLVRLGPVVARVATTTARVREASAFDWLARDVSLAGWLAERGAEVVPPSDLLPPGPHVRDGFAISFWRHVELVDTVASAAEARDALARLHAVLGDYSGSLPPLSSVVDECLVVAERVGIDGVREPLERIRSEIAALALPVRPLHGDASRSNLLRSADGLLWTDFEDTCLGPLEWDLTCMERSIDRSRPGARDPFWELRELQGRLWRALLGVPG